MANGPGAIPDAPVVTFESPSADTTMVRGSAIAFAVSIESRHELAAVRAEVSGALNYRFPPSTPADSVFTAVYRVQTNETTGDTVLVTVTATDVLGNRGVGRRSVSLR